MDIAGVRVTVCRWENFGTRFGCVFENVFVLYIFRILYMFGLFYCLHDDKGNVDTTKIYVLGKMYRLVS